MQIGTIARPSGRWREARRNFDSKSASFRRKDFIDCVLRYVSLAASLLRALH
jgi:hypothetical protein